VSALPTARASSSACREPERWARLYVSISSGTNLPMAITTGKRRRRSPTSLPWPTPSPKSGSAPAATRPRSSPDGSTTMTSKKPSSVLPPLGATVTDSGVSFAVYSETAETIWVCLFDDHDEQTDRVELIRGEGNVWHTHVDGLAAGASYGLRADGRYDPAQGYYFDPNKLLVD